MIGRTNVGGGGSGGTAFAYIGVTYPAGATLTCSDGNRTLRAKDTTGLYVFGVPYAATWTVTATDGIVSSSKSVEITTLWQDVTISIILADGTLFDNGNQYTEITGGWAKNSNMTFSSATPMVNSGGVYIASSINTSVTQTAANTIYIALAQTLEKVRINNPESITFVVESVRNNPMIGFAFTDVNSGSGISPQYSTGATTMTGAGTFTWSINDELVGDYYVSVFQWMRTSVKTTASCYIEKIKLNY